MIRVRLLLHYDGRDFHGWQVQPGLRTVQGEIEAVLERISGEHRTLLGSGRTDSGVHATGQVATAHVPAHWTAERLQIALNALLPNDIWVERVEVVEGDFHPRYDATRRTYHYRVGTAPQSRSPFHRPFCWALAEPLDLELLRRTAAALPGTHSFRAFAKAGQPERGELCTVYAASWAPWGEAAARSAGRAAPLGVEFTITANRYLHHMVRYLVGTQVAIARGERPEGDLALLLADPDAGSTSRPAPPEGLYLALVEYTEVDEGSTGASDDLTPDPDHPGDSQ